MRTIMGKMTAREIKNSLGRYLAIFAIIALGVGFFAGLRVSKSAMVQTANTFIAESNFFDYRLVSTLGFKQEDIDAFAATAGVKRAEGSVTLDFLTESVGNGEVVLRAHTLTDGINIPEVLEGRMPQAPNECIADAHLLASCDLGQEIVLSAANDADTFDDFAYDSYTVVGMVSSPYYINFERGNTSLGSGSVAAFVYLPPAGFSTEYYTEAFVTLEQGGYLYSEEYKANAAAMEDPLTAICKQRADIRYHSILDEADEKIGDAEVELADAKQEYLDKKADAEQELDDALAELYDGEKEVADARQEVADAEAKIAVGQELLDDGQAEIDTGWAQLDMKIEAAKKQLDAAKADLQSKRKQAQSAYDALLPQQDTLEATKAQLEAAGMTDTEQYRQVLTALATLSALPGQIAQIDDGLAQVQDGYFELKEQRLDTERELKDAQTKLDESAQELEDGKKELVDGKKELADGERELTDGWQEYRDGRAEADEEFAKAEQKIADADEELADARTELADLEYPTVYVLDRDTNIGYACFDSDTSIVQGISTVFPLFFFAVAALVCITTMTRMVDEQRTLIGTLKALGYDRGAIMRKFTTYSGSAALLGCVFGFLLGSWGFPKVVWAGYNVMYNFSDGRLEFVLDWTLAAISLAVALLCSIGATWFACRAELHDVPAELIRPKSPKAGRRILLERIPFVWNRLKFLLKVSIRNVFRYRSRFVMMVLGIGGCTALLLTGFGINDSVQNVVNYQYDEISIYDYSVDFTNPRDSSAQEAFTEKFVGFTDGILFLHEGTVDVDTPEGTKPAYLVATDDGAALAPFVDLHDGTRAVAYPGDGEAVINDNLAAILGVSVGDTMTLRDSDMKLLTLTVSGVFDNYVYNYVYITPQTCVDQWGAAPEIKTAYVNNGEGQDLHRTASAMLGSDGVANVTISEDTRARVSTMMSSIDYIVALVVACAGALAFIVLYNLTNINITERVREIATIKVLGFYSGETASYVLRENLILTAFGAAFGLLGGRWLHAFVMTQIKIDLMHFDIRIAGVSYLYAILLTFVFSVVVDFFMYFKLRRIDMAESLKSIE